MVTKLKIDFDKLNFEGQTKLLVFLLDILGYAKLENGENFHRNETILCMVYPKINFDYIIEFHNGNVDDKKHLVNKINYYVNLLIDQGYTKEESTEKNKIRALERKLKKISDK